MRYLFAQLDTSTDGGSRRIHPNVRYVDCESDGEAIEHITDLINARYQQFKSAGLTQEIDRFLERDLLVTYLYKIPPSGIMPEMDAEKWFQHLICGWEFLHEVERVYPRLKPDKLN